MQKKTEKQIQIAILAGMGVYLISYYRKVSATKRLKRAYIQSELQKDIAAIQTAKATVIERLHDGKLPHDLDALMEDFEFERIVARFDD